MTEKARRLLRSRVEDQLWQVPKMLMCAACKQRSSTLTAALRCYAAVEGPQGLPKGVLQGGHRQQYEDVYKACYTSAINYEAISVLTASFAFANGSHGTVSGQRGRSLCWRTVVERKPSQAFSLLYSTASASVLRLAVPGIRPVLAASPRPRGPRHMTPAAHAT